MNEETAPKRSVAMHALNHELDFLGPLYVYLVVADHIQALVEQGELMPSDRLPSAEQFAKRYRIGVGSVLRAFKVLRERGIAITKHAKGTFIA